MLSSIIIGFVCLQLLVSAFAKSVDAGGFFQLLRAYKFMPEILVPLVCTCVILVEWFLGAFLLVGGCEQQVIQGCILFLTAMTLSGIWIFLSMQGKDCGCYGELIPMTPLTSSVINFFSIWGNSLR